LNDVPVLEMVGLSVTAADAPDYVKKACDLVTRAEGGNGVFREIVDLLLQKKRSSQLNGPRWAVRPADKHRIRNLLQVYLTPRCALCDSGRSFCRAQGQCLSPGTDACCEDAGRYHRSEARIAFRIRCHCQQNESERTRTP